MTRARGNGALPQDTRAAVYIEYLIAILPVVTFFIATWGLIEMLAADLVLRRAASAAARAAVVVLPDDPHFYDGAPENVVGGKRKEDIDLAAAMILEASGHFRDYHVDIEGERKESAPLTATVRAQYYCGAGWTSIVCGGTSRWLTEKATYAYQGAPFKYEL